MNISKILVNKEQIMILLNKNLKKQIKLKFKNN